MSRATWPARPERWRAGLATAFRHERTPRIGFVLAAVAAFALLIYLGRSLTFYNDEWTFILERRDLSLDDLVRPHNEHWSTFLVLWYGSLFSIFGLTSYLPYLAALLVLHVIVAWGVFRLAERAAGGWVALGLAGLMLFLGSGHQNLYWAFQAGFVGATAAGTWALVALRGLGGTRSVLPAAILLTVAVAIVGIGLFFVAACAALIVADGTWRRRWLAVAVPTVVYAAWFVLVGRGVVSHHRDPFTAEALASVPAYVVRGLEWSVGAMTGWGPEVGRILVVLAAVAVGWIVMRGGRPSPLVLAAGAGVLALYAVTGLVRAQFGVDQATEARYTYVAAALLLPAIGAALGAWIGRALSWRHAVLLPLLPVALLANGYALLPGKVGFQERADFTRAYVEVVTSHRDAPAVIESQGIFPFPAPAELLRLIAAYGSPLSDRWFPSVAPATTPELRDQALAGMLAAGVVIERTAEAATGAGALAVLTAQHVSWTTDGTSCVAIETSGAAPSVTLRLQEADDLTVRAGSGGVLSVALGLETVPQAALATGPIEAGMTYLVRLPDLGPEPSWTVRLDLPAVRGPTTVCSSDAAD